MFRSLKRRVKGLGSDSRLRKDEQRVEQSNLDTPRRTIEAVGGDTGSSAEKPKVRRHKSNNMDDFTSKIPHLASFDKCIETSDAMIASSSAQQSESILSDRKDTNTGLPDCSLLVSPDGEFLLVPTGHKKLFVKDLQLSSFSELMLHGKDDYPSSVFIGDDLHGDKRLNRFSAKGWSIAATSVALDQAGASLQSMAHFCEQIVLSQKECAARTSIACDNLRRHEMAPSQKTSSWEIVDPRATDFDMTPERIEGPFGTGTLARATEAVSNYYSGVAEMEARRWRSASLQGVLPALHGACDKFVHRSKNRHSALQESTQRARRMEEKLQKLQTVADKKWQAVYRAEDRVTKRMEDLMTERSKEKQKARLKQLHESSGGATDTASPSSITSNNNNLSEEVWNMVSSVAESIDNGSYEPMCNSIPSDVASTVSDDCASLPMVDREDIERELHLPALRSAALQADDDVVDAGDTLLNLLSSLDTTRRSAKVAAETCLASAGNAQETCLRAMIDLERKSLQERLRALEGIDDALDAIDVRSDVDLYISRDKKVRGGTSHLADDDDGGIASALATLSSHVEGNFDPSKVAEFDLDESEQGEKMSTSRLNLAVDQLFQRNEHLQSTAATSDPTVAKTRSEYAKNTAFLCKATEGNTGSTKARRSAICYALNSKRGTHARLNTTIQFDALCEIFTQVLTGCQEDGVSNAKMCMMLAQTFYTEGDGDATTAPNDSSGEESSPRTRRIYAKNKLTNHPIWSSDEFWDTALSQQIAESLAHSGVMSNFTRRIRRANRTEYAQTRKTKWHDLNYTERIEAAAQVHAVVFAQLGALAHSMIELGCGLDRSCAFVRRMSVRNQLPSSQRTMLLSHLMQRDNVERRESIRNDSSECQKTEMSSPANNSDVTPVNTNSTAEQTSAGTDQGSASPGAEVNSINEPPFVDTSDAKSLDVAAGEPESPLSDSQAVGTSN